MTLTAATLAALPFFATAVPLFVAFRRGLARPLWHGICLAGAIVTTAVNVVLAPTVTVLLWVSTVALQALALRMSVRTHRQVKRSKRRAERELVQGHVEALLTPEDRDWVARQLAPTRLEMPSPPAPKVPRVNRLRPYVPALGAALASALLGFLFSLALGTPRLWPGTVVAFVVALLWNGGLAWVWERRKAAQIAAARQAWEVRRG